MLELWKFMFFFHIFLFKSWQWNPAKYCLTKIAKLCTNRVVPWESTMLFTIITNTWVWEQVIGMDLGLGAARQCSSTRKAVSMATQWEAPTRYHHTELLYGVSIKYHNYNKILKFDWLSTVPISELPGQCNRTARVTLSNWTVCAIAYVDFNGFFFTASKKLLEFHVFWFKTA